AARHAFHGRAHRRADRRQAGSRAPAAAAGDGSGGGHALARPGPPAARLAVMRGTPVIPEAERSEAIRDLMRRVGTPSRDPGSERCSPLARTAPSGMTGDLLLLD